MELLVLLVLLLMAWVALSRWAAGRARRPRFPALIVVLTLVVGGWIAVQLLAPAPSGKADYSSGDTALRQLLE